MNQPNKLKIAYYELNEAKKKALREAFFEEFEYSKTSSSFWRKINDTACLWKQEKVFFAKELNMNFSDLF